MAPKAKPHPNVSIQNLINRYYAGMLSPQQQRQQARKDTNLALKDSLRDLRSTYQQETERALRQQYAMSQASSYLRGSAGPGSPDAQAIRDLYAKAAGQNQAFSGGVIQSTTGAQQGNVDTAGAQDAALANYSGPSQEPSAGANAQVLNYLNSLPAGSFAAQGEAAAMGLNRQAATAAGGFSTQAAQVAGQLRDLADKYSMARHDIDRTRAGEFQKALSGMRESGRGDLATLINAMYLQNTQQKDVAALTGTFKGKPTLTARQTAAEIAIKNATAQSQAADRTARAEIARMNAATSRQRANIAQQAVNLQKAGTAGDMAKLETDFRKNAQKYVAGIIGVNPKTGVPRRTPPSRQSLINYVYRLYGAPLAGKFGLTKQQLALWAAQVVSTFPPSLWAKGGATAGKAGATGKTSGTKPVTDLGGQ